MARRGGIGAAALLGALGVAAACSTARGRGDGATGGAEAHALRRGHLALGEGGAGDGGAPDAGAGDGETADGGQDAAADASEDGAAYDAWTGPPMDCGAGADGGAAERHLWTAMSPASSPSTRDSFSMTYDSTRGLVVLFGGEVCYAFSQYCTVPIDDGGIPVTNVLNDTWTWDGTTWTRQSPPQSPPPRQSAQMAFDRARGVAVLFGGQDADQNDLSDTWEWNGSTWTQVAFSGPTPDPRDQYGMAYDIARGVTVMFAGEECPAGGCPPPMGQTQIPQADTWVWDGGAWALQTPAHSPAARMSHSLVYDEGRAVTVLFGGISCFSNACTSPSVEFNDTWTWDGSDWTQLSPCTAPSPRDSYAMAFDPRRDVMVLFGGYGAGTDTWEWNGTTWSNVTENPAPGYRYWGHMTFDELLGNAVLFGGTLDAYDLGDTWTYHAHGGTCASAASCDTGNCVDGTCCEVASCGTCQSCNVTGAAGTCSAILGASDPPSCSGTHTCDSTGQCRLVVGQACPNGNSDCANGACVDGFCCNTTCTGACDSCSTALGASANGTCGPATRGYAGNPACGGGLVCDGKSVSCPSACVADTDCATGFYCAANQSCAPQKTQGASCNVTAGAECSENGCHECLSGACADGVCCDSACGAPCEVCARASGASADGTCTNAPQGSAGKNGASSGAACAPYVCSGAASSCPSSCATESDCVSGALCGGAMHRRAARDVRRRSHGDGRRWKADGLLSLHLRHERVPYVVRQHRELCLSGGLRRGLAMRPRPGGSGGRGGVHRRPCAQALRAIQAIRDRRRGARFARHFGCGCAAATAYAVLPAVADARTLVECR
jgi:hypothetical protein